MTGLAISAGRLSALASGRGDVPNAAEWPIVLLLLLVFGIVGAKILRTLGLSWPESILVAGISPSLVFLDAPLGEVAPRVALAANLTGCVVPFAVTLKMLAERRLPWLELSVVVLVGVAAAFLNSDVVPTRGVLLQYRAPALIIGFLAAGLLFRTPERAGAAAFAAGTLGVIIGADIMNLRLLAEGGAGRIVLGGAGLLDGILLVAVLGAAVAEGTAIVLRSLVKGRAGQRAPA